MLNLLSGILNPVYCDAPEPWQIGFQDGATKVFEEITVLHDSIFFYLIVIFMGVAWVLGSVLVNFSSTKSPIVYKYANHGFKSVLLWGVWVLFVISLVSFVPVSNGTLEMSLLPVLFNSGYRKVVGISDENKETPGSVIVSPTPKMLRAMNTLKNDLSVLSSQKDDTVYNWLMSLHEVQLLVKDKLRPVTFNTKNDCLVAAHCVKGNKPLNTNTPGVYIFFNPEDGQSYVGSAISLYLRYAQHASLARKYRRYTNKNLPTGRDFSNKLYGYLYNLDGNINGMYWGVFIIYTTVLFTDVPINTYKSYIN